MVHHGNPVRWHRLTNDVWHHHSTNEVKDSVIFFTNQYLMYRYIVEVSKCMIKIFMGQEGWWRGGGIAVKGCLKSGVGVIKNLSKNILKQGVDKGKSCS